MRDLFWVKTNKKHIRLAYRMCTWLWIYFCSKICVIAHKRVNSEKHEKREKRQSVPQPLKQPASNHHHHQQKHQYQSYQGNQVAPPPPMFSRSRHRQSNNRDSSLSPCSSDVIMNHSLNASSGSLSSVSSDRSASTDCVEYVTDVPFAGNFVFH